MKRCLMVVMTALILLLAGTPAVACTVFNATQDSKTFVGNNEDGLNANTKVWFLAPEKDKFGAVFFGYDDAWVQGGMNDCGLFLDWATTERVPMTPSPDKLDYKGNMRILYYGNLNEKVLRECSNVNEAIKFYEKYNETSFQYAHVMLADKTGASAVLEWYQGKMNVLKREDKYQFMTNFNITKSRLTGYDCKRYSTLERLLYDNADTSIDNFRSILKEVSQDITVYSNIYDLGTGDIYVYYRRNFDRVIKLNINVELKKGSHMYDLGALFGQPSVSETNDEVNNKNPFSTQLNKALIKIVRMVLIFFIAVFFILYILRLQKKNKDRNQKLYFRADEVNGLIIAIINALLCIALFDGLVKYGFFIRYRFSLYENILFSAPVLIAILTITQLIFMLLSWIKRLWSLTERIVYTLHTFLSILIIYFIQAFSWMLL